MRSPRKRVEIEEGGRERREEKRRKRRKEKKDLTNKSLIFQHLEAGWGRSQTRV